MEIPHQPGAAAVPPAAGTGTGGPDSGVETEDQESNDSSLSNVSLGGPIQPPTLQVQQQPIVVNDSFQVPSLSSSASASIIAVAGSSSSMMSSSRITPEPLPSFLHPNGLQPPPSVTEDGYLGDCSSDGGNEKNFPMPSHLLKRLVNGKSCHCHPESKSDCNSNPSDSEAPDPPAGLSFQNVSSSTSSSSAFGYQVLPQNFHYEGGSEKQYQQSSSSSHSRKMKSSVRTKIVAKGDTWYTMTAALTERKLRTAACTNNTDTLQRLLANGVNVNTSDGQRRTALHFGASKGYSEVVNTLLQYGADPNAKDILGNTALHLAACTNHIEVVTLLLRAGTDVTTLDNSGRTPIQLAQSKLKLLQKNSSKSLAEMTKVKTEVSQVVDMMREYLSKTGAIQGNSTYSDLLNSFSQRLTLHNNQDELHSDLANLLDTLGNLHLDKA